MRRFSNTPKKKTLFAIYKFGLHKGNVREKTAFAAINQYVLDSGYSAEDVADPIFLSRYFATPAVLGIHCELPYDIH